MMCITHVYNPRITTELDMGLGVEKPSKYMKEKIIPNTVRVDSESYPSKNSRFKHYTASIFPSFPTYPQY